MGSGRGVRVRGHSACRRTVARSLANGTQVTFRYEAVKVVEVHAAHPLHGEGVDPVLADAGGVCELEPPVSGRLVEQPGSQVTGPGAGMVVSGVAGDGDDAGFAGVTVVGVDDGECRRSMRPVWSAGPTPGNACAEACGWLRVWRAELCRGRHCGPHPGRRHRRGTRWRKAWDVRSRLRATGRGVGSRQKRMEVRAAASSVRWLMRLW